MDKDLIRILFALLRFEVNSAELCESDKNLITEDVLKGLYNLSKRHDLAHLVGDALDKNGLLRDGSEAKKRFLQERNMALYRYEQLQYEFDRVCEVFEKEKIPFIPLKGAVVRQYYPEPWMRTSCDIDVLVKKENLSNAIDVLKKELRYTGDQIESSHDVSLFSDNGVHLELHFDLTEGDKYAKKVLSRIWSYTLPRLENSCYFLMSNSAFYVYHITHMIKHFECGGCGIKPFLDMWCVDKVLPADEECVRLLKLAGIERFEQYARKLSLVWSGQDSHDDITIQMEEYIFQGGVYGSMENRVLTQQTKSGGKAKYLLSRIFLPYKELAIKYPVLKKCPILYPFFLIRRWFNLFCKKGTGKRVAKEFRASVETDKTQRERQKKLMNKLGI